MKRLLTSAAAMMLVAAMPVSAQQRTPAPLNQAVVAAIDRLYPGFTEIIETCAPAFVARLARVLAANPSPQSLSVLMTMLQRCPTWDGNEENEALQLETVAGSVGRLPVVALSEALQSAEP